DGEAASLAWSPDGKTFAVGQRPLDQPEAPARQLCLYDAATGKLTAERHRDDWSVEQIAWSPDNRRLLVTGEDTPAWLVERDELSPRAMPHPFPWNPSLAWNEDGVPLAAGFAQVEGKLAGQLWQADPPKLLRTFATQLEGERIGWLALSGDGRFAAAGCRDTIYGYPSERAAYVYEAATGNPVAHFDQSAGHPGPWIFPKEEAPVNLWEYEPRYAISSDGKRLARCGHHLGGPVITEVRSELCVADRRQITMGWRSYQKMFCASWSHEGGSLAWRGEDGAIRFWPRATTSGQVAAPAPPWGYPGLSCFAATDLQWSPDDLSLTAAFDNSTRFDRYSSITGELQWMRSTPSESPMCGYAPAFSSHGQDFAVRLNAGFRVGVFDRETTTPKKTLDAVTDDIVVWSSDAQQLAVYRGEATEIWDIEANECVRRFDGGRASLLWSPDGLRFVLSGSGEATIHEAASGNVLHSLNDPPLGPAKIWPRLAWSPNSGRIAGRGRIWDAETGEVIARLPGAAVAGETGAPAWSADGATVAYLGPGRAVVVAAVAPKVRHSIAQGATLGQVDAQNIVALKGRDSDSAHGAVGPSNANGTGESRPVGADNSNSADTQGSAALH
ncbi:MAG TPA: WD40 repeat domain-containing protein, partial [Pirellulales bacterium]|nr:WD40 repeat domain-containing protein [Pirellulales bacterium]